MSMLKVCGNYLPVDLDLLQEVEDQIDHIGFIFTPVSKRWVSQEQVAKWMEEYPFLKEKAVGVFLNQELSEVEQMIQTTGIKHVQLHGEETPSFCEELKKRYLVSLWKVFSVEEGQINQDITPYASVIDHVLLDTKVKGISGGTGIQFDWSIIPPIYQKLSAYNLNLWIAGGISPDNITELLKEYPLDGVDLASGVEGRKGKDKEKLYQLIERMRHYAQR